MGKRYYCDYCERSFADGAENRKKHLASLNHQKLRKAHYDMFKDAATILEENKLKNPCRKYHQTGYCEYEMGCKYSHLTSLDIQKLEEEVRLKNTNYEVDNVDEDVNSWIQSKMSSVKKIKVSSDTSDPVLPPVLLNIPNLPPSLIPPTASQIVKAKNADVLDWG